MTKVQDMTNEKLDFAIADLLGWVNAWDGLRLVWLDGKTSEFRRMVSEWSPSTDPVAADEVQAKAIEVDAKKYGINLARLLEWDNDSDPLSYSDNDLFSYNGVVVFLQATNRQRAEAAYITLKDREV